MTVSGCLVFSLLYQYLVRKEVYKMRGVCIINDVTVHVVHIM